MKLNRKNVIYWAVTAVIILGLILIPAIHHRHTAAAKGKSPRVAKVTTSAQKDSVMRTPIDYRKPSETKPYPDIKQAKDFWIKVSISKNRAYLYDGHHLLYTMYCSAGKYETDKKTGKKKSLTPTGTYHVQAERGESFYNPSVSSGANYYVSWKDHGSYLFHSVPTDANGHYIKKEAAKLGKSTGSHGCVRLSIPDAKWVYQNVPEGTKVVITE